MTKQTSKTVPTESGKWKAVTSAMDQIQEKFGAGSIMKLSDSKTMDVESIPTGSISLDLALGVGGIPKGQGN